ncbi:MAG: hypothetical protein WCH10_04600 [bacterium]
MHKILISIPENLVSRLRVNIPSRKRVIEKEIEQRERNLYACALEIEKDKLLNEEMWMWDVTISDGLK